MFDIFFPLSLSLVFFFVRSFAAPSRCIYVCGVKSHSIPYRNVFHQIHACLHHRHNTKRFDAEVIYEYAVVTTLFLSKFIVLSTAISIFEHIRTCHQLMEGAAEIERGILFPMGNCCDRNWSIESKCWRVSVNFRRTMQTSGGRWTSERKKNRKINCLLLWDAMT